MRHVMLDLETFGLKPGHMIRSVGAVEFDIVTGNLGNEFYCNVDEKSCKKLKMTKDAETEAWWNDPKKSEANAQLLVDPLPLPVVNERFVKFFQGSGAEFLWSQGSNFDGVLYEHALLLTGHKPPWKFFKAFDTRTAYFMADLNTFTIPRNGTYHNALDDAKHQAMCLHRSYLKIQGRIL